MVSDSSWPPAAPSSSKDAVEAWFDPRFNRERARTKASHSGNSRARSGIIDSKVAGSILATNRGFAGVATAEAAVYFIALVTSPERTYATASSDVENRRSPGVAYPTTLAKNWHETVFLLSSTYRTTVPPAGI
nr:capsid [Humaita-Tubiacanga virus]